ncbi:MAG: hypothetical protein F6K08_11765 [Okeania sp. SIO1H6]|uniref:Plasmid segregation centromere-binding protein ParR n=2 Tax=Microcoleaceae TaxID=1892252 RepID=A0A3N6P3K2_9CYAN|nr:hypothetical protein [Okeania sp. SIO4D6]NEP40522.1 hypothetical protein [Okeania sp. SIO2H7]NEP71994.1 hypothetical protein [Okeania sp. SIO2G5]NEP95214.1 hypothetical protein [Okeania sp. SIO2F5]NEQ91147.1 hypothetical protein [Okeania sp. SIO2G4]NES77202.1 hypothetical protein [Okeania sp. SIO1H4]NES93646.1 hypothetical protein [Okeania sp. SIO2B9]NET13476.1 hypothetical protein [Okeania sp. SIO1H6]NET19269.1 hypothetical protein [Okeania sp. SIO1H5]NET74876.1 hypothetical protein [O
MMLWEKNQKKEVFFTEEAADKQLLVAIEKELNSQKYRTFSNLCKQALWQFLDVSSSSTELAKSASNLQRLEHRIYEKLTKHFSELETKLVSDELNTSNNTVQSNENELKKHLNQLHQQLTQIQLNLDAKFIEVMESFKTELSQIEIPITKSAQEESEELTPTNTKPTEEDLSVQQSTTDADPLLQRLSSLLEEF